MIQIADIYSLTSFLRDHKAHLERLAASGRPEVLTVNVKARVVVQDAEAYQEMLEALDAAETERIVRERLAAVGRAEPGIPADEVLADVRTRLGVQRRRHARRDPDNG